MPTQEELNAAQVELDIANDNYAALADRYNKYQKLFQEYANASPEIQERAKEAMGYALEDFYQTQEKMRTAEDRIAVAQNALNNYNSIIASQPVQQTVTSQPTARRRIINPTPTPIIEEPIIEQPVNQYQVTPYINNPVNLNLRKWTAPVYTEQTPVSTPVSNNWYYKSNTLRWILWNAWHNLNDFWQMTKGSFRNMNNALNRASDATGRFLIWTPQRQL